MIKKFLFHATLLAIIVLATGASVFKPEARIIGGKEVDIAAHPYLVSIRYRESPAQPYVHKCAGSIYSATVIITGAQCVEEIGAEDRIMIVAGKNTHIGVDGQIYPVEKWFKHPNYTFWTIDYDVGILILETPLTMNNNVEAISIRNIRPAVGKFGTVSGWGYREENGPASYMLEEARVPIVSQEDCIEAYGVGEVTERMICAGYKNAGGVDACKGDTGGPLVVDGQLVGLVSWGRGCARPGYPGVYTFVGSLKKWIDDTIAANA